MEERLTDEQIKSFPTFLTERKAEIALSITGKLTRQKQHVARKAVIEHKEMFFSFQRANFKTKGKGHTMLSPD